CKICRRLGQKTFLKGDRCLSPKCPFIKRPYPPGPKKKKRGGSFSEFAKELKEKQKLQKYYGLGERQFRNYVKKALKNRGQGEDATLILLRNLEKRLDNVVFRLGFAKSRSEAKQMVSHGYFLVNKKLVSVSSFATKKGMAISFKETKQEKPIFKNISSIIKNYQAPSWLDLDKTKMEGKIVSEPAGEDVNNIDISSIFEYYSR
ncbi:MAG: 30S ribosomal protein S4, partial [Candidatus Pacebacteria bacterium]|nr:30S ribosomal protein S4 [Candidatus Paceibacterota bacterium]